MLIRPFLYPHLPDHTSCPSHLIRYLFSTLIKTDPGSHCALWVHIKRVNTSYWRIICHIKSSLTRIQRASPTRVDDTTQSNVNKCTYNNRCANAKASFKSKHTCTCIFNLRYKGFDELDNVISHPELYILTFTSCILDIKFTWDVRPGVWQ